MESDIVEEAIFREGFSEIILGYDTSVCEERAVGGRLAVTNSTYKD